VRALVSETEHDESTYIEETEGEEDLNTASAVYSVSTNLARSVVTANTPSSRAYSPLPTTEWDSIILPRAPLPPKPFATSLPPIPLGLIPPKPRPLTERIGPILNTKPLLGRIGGLYIPPAARYRDDSEFWQSQRIPRIRSKFRPTTRDDASWWQSQSQSNTIKRQRENIRLSQGNHPGPSRKSHLQPSFSQIATLFHTLGEKLFDIKIDDLEVKHGEGIEEVEYVGSYKWIESDDGPTLAVPGKLALLSLGGGANIEPYLIFGIHPRLWGDWCMIKIFRIMRSFPIVSLPVLYFVEAEDQTLRLYYPHHCRLSNRYSYHLPHPTCYTISTWLPAVTTFENYGQRVEKPIITIHPPGGLILSISIVVIRHPV